MANVTQAYTWNTGDVITAARLNANPQAFVAAFANIDNTNIGAAGLFASQIKPTNSAQATFGGSAAGYTFVAPSTSIVPLTVAGVAGQTADLFDVTLTNGGTKAVAVTNGGNLLVGASGTAGAFVGVANATAYAGIGAGGAGSVGGVTPDVLGIFAGPANTDTLYAALNTLGNFGVSGSFAAAQQVIASSNGSTQAYVPPLYAAGGASLGPTTHAVIGSGQLNGAGTLVITLTGAAVFLGSSAYTVCASGSSAGGAIYVTYTSGSQFTLTGSANALFTYLAVGT